MLGGNQARADAASYGERWNAVRINHRSDLKRQTKKMLKLVEYSADNLAVSEDVSEAQVSAEAPDRAIAGAHIALWKRCAAEDKALPILEDGLMLPHKLPQALSHITQVVERVCDMATAEIPAILLLGCNQMSVEEQWLPTDLQTMKGDKVVLFQVDHLRIDSRALLVGMSRPQTIEDLSFAPSKWTRLLSRGFTEN